MSDEPLEAEDVPWILYRIALVLERIAEALEDTRAT